MFTKRFQLTHDQFDGTTCFRYCLKPVFITLCSRSWALSLLLGERICVKLHLEDGQNGRSFVRTCPFVRYVCQGHPSYGGRGERSAMFHKKI